MRSAKPVSSLGSDGATPLPSRTFAQAGKRRRRQSALAAIIVMSCSALPVRSSISFAKAQSASPAAERQPLPVKPSAKAESEDRSKPFASVVIPATIQAYFNTDLYAKDSGYVSQVNNDIGDHVKQGQVLAVIEDPELQAQFDKAQAAVLQASADIEVAKRQLAAMQADLILQQVTLNRQKELFAGKASTAQTLDEARAKEGVSSANLETGKARIKLAEANLDAANAEAERLRALLEYDKIVAPYNCVVTRRLVNPGDLVQAATSTRTAPLFTCQEIDMVRVLADAPEANAAGIHPGLPAEVRLYGEAPLTVSGTVTRIATALDPATRTMRVEIDLPNPDEKLLPGMYAQVTLRTAPQLMDPPKP
jgi:multidrug efflux pump subunit AcrA (membrane-fusion protein)